MPGLNVNATRMLTGLILGTVAMLCIIEGRLAFLVLMLTILFFATKEYVKILNCKGFYPSLSIIVFSEILLAIIAYFQKFDLVAPTFTIGVFCAFLWILFRGRQPYIANVATTVLGMVYCGWLPLHLIFLRHLHCDRFHDGLVFVVMVFMAVMVTDIGCYYAGRHLGKHKLAPVISPNKTIEGSVGGAICSVIMSFIIGLYMGLEWYFCRAIGLLCTTAGQLGDLSESLIKRDAGVKDSGHTLPGHGGFLDRFDGYIFAIPVMYYFCKHFIFSDYLVNSVTTFFKGLF